MMDVFLAHSAQNGHPAQTYESHIRGVCEKAAKYAADAERYSTKAAGMLSGK